jgi:hypothetical protein
MAFNPLHFFRKRKKTLLAGLTIMCMVLFVLSSGTKGDIFNLGLFGGGHRNDPQVKQPDGNDFLFNGKKLYASDLSKAFEERRLAASYLMGAYATAQENVGKELKELEKLIKSDPSVIKRAEELRHQGSELQMRMFQEQFSLTNQLDDLLDYMYFRDEAKRQGFSLTDEDIDKLLSEKTFNEADFDRVQKALIAEHGRKSEEKSLSKRDIYDAVRNDYAVRQIKTMMLGADQPLSFFGPPVHSTEPPTPYGRYEEFLKNRSANSVAVIDVPVENYLDKVTEKPTEEELKQLYEKHKSREYNPSEKRPGFLEPRRVHLEWVSGRADSEHFQELSRTLTRSSIAMAPGDPLPAVDLATSLTHKYAKETTGAFTSAYTLPPLTDPNFALPYYTSLSGPENVATLVGMLANGSTQPDALAAIANYQASCAAKQSPEQTAALNQEMDKRLKVGTSLAFNLADPNRIGAASLLAYFGQTKQYLPFEAVAPRLLRELEAKNAQTLLILALTQLKKDLEARRSKPAKETREWLDKTIAELGLTHQIVEKPLGQYEVVDDPQMQPLKEAYLRERKAQDPKAEHFGSLFFSAGQGASKFGLFQAKDWPEGVTNASFGFVSQEEQPFLFWKTKEDDQPREPKFEEARPKIEAAWRLQKARELAKKAAEDLQTKVKEADGDVQKIKDIAAGAHLKYSELNGVARLVTSDVAHANRGRSYKPYEFPPDALPHSGPPTQKDVLDKLVALNKIGETAVFSDQPVDHYYVASVYNRIVWNIRDFFDAYRASTRPGAEQDHLFDTMDSGRTVEEQRKILKQIRAKLGPVNDKGDYNIDPELKQDLEKGLTRRN